MLRKETPEWPCEKVGDPAMSTLPCQPWQSACKPDLSTISRVAHTRSIQRGDPWEVEPETGTVGTVFPGIETGTRTVRLGTEEWKPEPEPCFALQIVERRNPLPRGTVRAPKQETARTAPCASCIRTEPNWGHPGHCWNQMHPRDST